MRLVEGSSNTYVETGYAGANVGCVTTERGIVMIESPMRPSDAVARFDCPSNSGGWPVDIEELYDIVDELDVVAQAHNSTIAQAALNYLLHKPGVSSLIIGIRTAKQLEQNIGATDWEMNPEEVTRLDRVSEPVRKHPYYKYNPVKKPASHA